MPAKHELMRNTNTLLVLEHIRQHGASTRRQIQRETNLSWAAVSNITADLIAASVLQETPFSGKSTGRNPGSLDFVPMHNLTIGVELNIEGLTFQLLDLRGNLVDMSVEPIYLAERDSVIQQILAGIASLLNTYSLTPEHVLGIGIATQGSVDRDGTMSLYNSFIKDWRNVPLKQICEDRFGIPVHVMHDPVSIALAEQWQRKLSGESDFAVIRLSYGIGMCYVAKGVPVTGRHGVAGELGHTVLDRNGPLCSCGNRGCMESYCSIRGIACRLDEAMAQGVLELPERFCTSAERDAFLMRGLVSWAANRARQGDATIAAIFDDAGYYLGVGIANVVSSFDPESVILIGDMLEYQDLFMEQAIKTANQLAWGLAKFDIILSGGGRRQASAGAALYYINKTFTQMDSRLLPKMQEEN